MREVMVELWLQNVRRAATFALDAFQKKEHERMLHALEQCEASIAWVREEMAKPK